MQTFYPVSNIVLRGESSVRVPGGNSIDMTKMEEIGAF